MTSLVYSTGTVSVSNASAIVTGTGTLWDTALVTGGMFSFAGLSVPIVSVESDTSLTLAYPWPGTSVSGAYAIARETSEAVRAAWINDRMARFMTKPWGTGVVPDGRGTLAERDALNPMPTDKYCWLREEPSFDPTLYFKSPSGWIGPYPLVGDEGPEGPAGTLHWIEAGWVTATAYANNDGLARGGSSYRCYAAHTSSAATEPGVGVDWATVWKVAAAKGDAGAAIGGLLTTRGDLAVQGASAAQRLALGVSGYALKSNGTDPVWAASREVLTANRTYYVRTDGNDANTGLANTAGGAFLTIAKALAVASSIDGSIYNMQITVGPGTWTVPVVLPQFIGSGQWTLIGDTTTPSNVIISTGTAGACIRANAINSTWRVRGFKLQCGTGRNGIEAMGGSSVQYGEIDFGACGTAHLYATNGSTLTAIQSTAISGGALIHWFISAASKLTDAGWTITLVGTPAFSNAFIQTDSCSVCAVNNNTFVGSATGVRYTVAANAVVGVNGAGTSYLPGSAAGSVSTGGLYA